jgi:RNA polymerase sigma factor (sigma-70 family)
MIAAEDFLLLKQTESPASADRNLVQRCIEGDQDAWKQLVKRYQRLIYSIALRICRDNEAAADVLQQVCLELYQRLDEVRNVASLPAWVGTVSRRKAFDYLRALRPTEPLMEEGPLDSGDPFGNIERQHTLERAMAALPERNRRLIEMMYMSGGGHSYEEMAAELGIPVASIGPTRIRSLKKLRKLLS